MNLLETPLTLVLIGLNLVCSLIGFSNPSFINKTILWPYGMKRQGGYHRFITSGFIHADFMHLFFNMFTLYFFGMAIEKTFGALFPLGNLWYIILYFTAMVVADIPSYLKNKDNPQYRSLGASGAVSAMVFAAVIFDPWQQFALYGFIKLSALLFAVLYVVYCIYMGRRQGDNVNHDAHLWGSLYGLVFTAVLVALLRPDIVPIILEELKNPSLFGR